MRLIFTLLLTFFLYNTYATDSTCIVKKKEVYFITEECKDSITWEEVCIKNKKMENKINTLIRSNIEEFKIKEPYIEERCNGGLQYEAASNVIYFKNNILSVYFQGHRIWPNFDSEIQIKTLNYDINYGKEVLFHDLFKPEKVSVIDSIIIGMTKEWYEEYEMTFGDEDIKNLRQQLSAADFIIKENEIIIYLKGIHCGYCTDDDPEFGFSFKDYGTYFNKRGVLKDLLKK